MVHRSSVLLSAGLFVAVIVGVGTNLHAQPASQTPGMQVLQAISALEKSKAAAISRIAECAATIAKSQAIMAAAKAKGNTHAERIATQALKNAEEAKRRNESTVTSIEVSLANLKKFPPTYRLSDRERERVKTRMGELRTEVENLQGHLRACMDATIKTFAEREALEKKISAAYDRSWKAFKEDLFMEVGTAGLGHIFDLRKANIDKVTAEAWKKIKATEDVNRKAQLLGFIEARQRDAALWKYNADLVQHMGELTTAHDVYEWDKEKAPFKEKFTEGMDMIAGVVVPCYGLAKLNVVAVSSVAAELSAWYKLKEIDKTNAGCSSETKSLSFKMEHRVKEINCLDQCVDHPAEGCVDKCRGKTSLHTPPPLPE